MVAVGKWRGHPALRWRPQSLAWVPAETLIIIAVIWSAIFTMADKQLPSNSSLRVASSNARFLENRVPWTGPITGHQTYGLLQQPQLPLGRIRRAGVR